VLNRRLLWECPRLKDLKCFFRDVAGQHPRGLRDVMVIAPHSDDAEIAAGAMMIYLAQQQIRVTACLVYAGYRCPGLSGEVDIRARTKCRVEEAQAACEVTGAQFRFFDVAAYSNDKYLPSDEDIELVSDEFRRLSPQVVFVPPRYDHGAHQAARELTALGLYGARLHQTQVITYESPWNSLGGPTPPTHYLAYGPETALRKDHAIRQFASQLVATDYVAYARHHAQAWQTKARESIVGHHDPCAWEGQSSTAGLEVFRLEDFDPKATQGQYADPIHLVLNRLRGMHDAEISAAQLTASR